MFLVMWPTEQKRFHGNLKTKGDQGSALISTYSSVHGNKVLIDMRVVEETRRSAFLTILAR